MLVPDNTGEVSCLNRLHIALCKSPLCRNTCFFGVFFLHLERSDIHLQVCLRRFLKTKIYLSNTCKMHRKIIIQSDIYKKSFISMPAVLLVFK